MQKNKVGPVDLEKRSMWELWVKFYLVENEDCSPGDSTLDGSEKTAPKT